MSENENKIQDKPTTEIRISIIDDDPEVVEIVERILSSRGYKTLGIPEAIGSTWKVKNFNPHIIIMDIKMPALNGINLLEVFKKTLPQMPKIILFSGIDQQQLQELANRINADAFIYKGEGYFRLVGTINLLAHEIYCQNKKSS